LQADDGAVFAEHARVRDVEARVAADLVLLAEQGRRRALVVGAFFRRCRSLVVR
jgi:hypothetical protein